MAHRREARMSVWFTSILVFTLMPGIRNCNKINNHYNKWQPIKQQHSRARYSIFNLLIFFCVLLFVNGESGLPNRNQIEECLDRRGENKRRNSNIIFLLFIRVI